MDNEIWKDIDGYEGLYQISNLGRVKSLDRRIKSSHKNGRTLKGRIMTNNKAHGYEWVYLSRDGNRKNHKIHRLIALAFIPNPENKPFINHKNLIRNDNRIENLEWCTPKENVAHAINMGAFTHIEKMTLKGNEAVRKKVIDTKTGITYNSITEASKAMGINRWTLNGRMLYRKHQTTLRYL